MGRKGGIAAHCPTSPLAASDSGAREARGARRSDDAGDATGTGLRRRRRTLGCIRGYRGLPTLWCFLCLPIYAVVLFEIQGTPGRAPASLVHQGRKKGPSLFAQMISFPGRVLLSILCVLALSSLDECATILPPGHWIDICFAVSTKQLANHEFPSPLRNLFLGSGLFNFRAANASGAPFAIGSDVGAGTSLSSFRTMNEAYKAHRFRRSGTEVVSSFGLLPDLTRELVPLR